MKKILISAGEPSGDMFAAGLADAVRRTMTDVSITAFGGPRLAAAGAEVRIPLVKYAVIGFAAVLSKLPGIMAAFFKAEKIIKTEKPDMLIVTDYPGFHLKLIRSAKKLGVKKIVYFITPQVWLWGKERIKTIRECCDFVINIFPFEKEIFEKAGVTAHYFGHPLAHMLKGIEAGKARPREVGVFPGSRKNEIRDFMGEITKACAAIKKSSPDVRFRAFAADSVRPAEITAPFKKAGLEIEISPGSDFAKRKALSAAIVKSGTAALEMALLKVPFTAVYRLKGIDYMIIRAKARGSDVRYAVLPNIIAGREIIRELIQEKFTAENVGSEISTLLAGGPALKQMEADFEELGKKLIIQGSPYEGAAEKIREALAC